MHRSGTSLLGSLLPQLGVELPGNLIPGDFHNPEGYYERRDVTELQEQLLIDLDRFWAGASGFKALPADWRSHAATKRFVVGLREILVEECIRQKGPWAIKDPRSSILLPIWRDLCNELGIPLQLVLAVRSPEAVMSSVMARDESLAGMTWWRAQQLWWRFNTAVLRSKTSLKESAPAVVNYESWFIDPEKQARSLAAALGLEVPDEKKLRSVRDLIRPEHRHHLSNNSDYEILDSRLISLHAWLKEQSRLKLPIRLAKELHSPRRPWQENLKHCVDWFWLVGSPLLPSKGLWAYRRSFLQGHGAGPLASPIWIARQRPELLRAFRDPLAWYQRFGWTMGVSPHPLIDPQMVWAHFAQRKEPVALYRREAMHDDIYVHSLFDPVFYRRNCFEREINPIPTPLEHYLVEGWQLGLSPHLRVDPIWMQNFYGLKEEPLTALALKGFDINDPGITHPFGNFYGSAISHPNCMARLPKTLVNLVKFWHDNDMWVASRWLASGALSEMLPGFDCLGKESSALFAKGLKPVAKDELRNACKSAAPALPKDSSWIAIQILKNFASQAFISNSITTKIHVLLDQKDIDKVIVKEIDMDWAVNLFWPSSSDLPGWINSLRLMRIVLDYDSERAAFLQLFGVNAYYQPLTKLTFLPDIQETLMRCAQLQLGLPDPRWFNAPLELAVIGSTGSEQERRWGVIALSAHAFGLLLLPRLPQIEISSVEELNALQVWLEKLSDSCGKLILLEPLAHGMCNVPASKEILGREDEFALLIQWEEKCL